MSNLEKMLREYELILFDTELECDKQFDTNDEHSCFREAEVLRDLCGALRKADRLSKAYGEILREEDTSTEGLKRLDEMQRGI